MWSWWRKGNNKMNLAWSYVPFAELFEWCQKSNIGSRESIENGQYKLFWKMAKDWCLVLVVILVYIM